MKPHPKIRKTVKWGGAVVTVLLVVVLVGSLWWMGLGCDGRGDGIQVESGCILLTYSVGDENVIWPDANWGFSRAVPELHWELYWGATGGSRWLAFPVLIPLLLSLIATGTAWRLDTLARHRARLNLCPKCNYDRTGIAPGAVCPECGTL